MADTSQMKPEERASRYGRSIADQHPTRKRFRKRAGQRKKPASSPSSANRHERNRAGQTRDNSRNAERGNERKRSDTDFGDVLRFLSETPMPELNGARENELFEAFVQCRPDVLKIAISNEQEVKSYAHEIYLRYWKMLSLCAGDESVPEAYTRFQGKLSGDLGETITAVVISGFHSAALISLPYGEEPSMLEKALRASVAKYLKSFWGRKRCHGLSLWSERHWKTELPAMLLEEIWRKFPAKNPSASIPEDVRNAMTEDIAAVLDHADRTSLTVAGCAYCVKLFGGSGANLWRDMSAVLAKQMLNPCATQEINDRVESSVTEKLSRVWNETHAILTASDLPQNEKSLLLTMHKGSMLKLDNQMFAELAKAVSEEMEKHREESESFFAEKKETAKAALEASGSRSRMLGAGSSGRAESKSSGAASNLRSLVTSISNGKHDNGTGKPEVLIPERVISAPSVRSEARTVKPSSHRGRS